MLRHKHTHVPKRRRIREKVIDWTEKEEPRMKDPCYLSPSDTKNIHIIYRSFYYDYMDYMTTLHNMLQILYKVYKLY